MTDQVEQQTEVEQTEAQARKYAGKFDTVEQLEEGYRNSAKIYQENETLKKQMESQNIVPDDYMQPQDVQLAEDDLKAIKNIARNAGLTQTHFEKVAREMAQRNQSQQQKFEQNVKDLGEEQLNVLKDYVSKNYPGKLADKVLKEVINDPEARQAALAHREQRLNTSVPGLSSVNMNSGYAVNHTDVLKAKEAVDKQPSNLKLRDHYINLTSQYAEQKNRT